MTGCTTSSGRARSTGTPASPRTGGEVRRPGPAGPGSGTSATRSCCGRCWTDANPGSWKPPEAIACRSFHDFRDTRAVACGTNPRSACSAAAPEEKSVNVLLSRRAGALVGVAAIAGAVTLVTTGGPAGAASPDVVISQVYGGGGNTGATYTNDYIQLYNAGAADVGLSGWSVQYASAAGSTWQVTTLTGTLASGARYLIQEAAGAGGTTPLPNPDATGSIAMSATAGKVALVTNQTALTTVCGATCHAAAGVRDYVGYGSTATDFEGTGPAPTLSNTTAALRAGGGAADFTAGPPDPAGSGGPPPPPPGIPAKVHDIQGAGHVSPLKDMQVTDVTGIVTAKAGNQFWLQDPAADADPATSEGIAVVGSTAAAAVSVGDAVTVAGKVQEFLPGPAGMAITEIASPTVVVNSQGNELPAATLVGPGGLVPPASVIDNTSAGYVEDRTTFDPATQGIDFWESMEGMLVRFDDPQVVGPTQLRFGETPIVPAGSGVRTP